MNALINENVIDEKRRECFFNCINRMKSEVKEISCEIRRLKDEIKQGQKSGRYVGGEMSSLQSEKNEARLLNIVYALARGKRYLQVENKVRENNEPNWSMIKHMLDARFQAVGLKIEIKDGLNGKAIEIIG